jgi:hypothetical protein
MASAASVEVAVAERINGLLLQADNIRLRASAPVILNVVISIRLSVIEFPEPAEVSPGTTPVRGRYPLPEPDRQKSG